MFPAWQWLQLLPLLNQPTCCPVPQPRAGPSCLCPPLLAYAFCTSPLHLFPPAAAAGPVRGAGPDVRSATAPHRIRQAGMPPASLEASSLPSLIIAQAMPAPIDRPAPLKPSSLCSLPTIAAADQVTENPLKAEVRSEDGQQRINVVVSQAAALKRTLFQVRIPTARPACRDMRSGRSRDGRVAAGGSCTGWHSRRHRGLHVCHPAL